jgi:hypothetical protein
MTTDWKALCVDLLREFSSLYSDMSAHVNFNETYMKRVDALISRTELALAQPEAEVSPWPVPGDAEGLAEVFWGCYEQPEPEGVTDEELLQVAATEIEPYGSSGIGLGEHEAETECAVEVYGSELIRFARAVLARWGRPAIKPVSVSERPWEREGWCDAEGRCWWGRVEGNPGNPEWFLAGLSEIEGFYEIGDWTVLLPHHALPVPTKPTQPTTAP